MACFQAGLDKAAVTVDGSSSSSSGNSSGSSETNSSEKKVEIHSKGSDLSGYDAGGLNLR